MCIMMTKTNETRVIFKTQLTLHVRWFGAKGTGANGVTVWEKTALFHVYRAFISV